MTAGTSVLYSTPRGQVARRFLRHKLAVASTVVLGLLILFAVSAPLVEMILGVDGDTVDLFGRYGSSSAAHPLGTDELGRDVLIRLMYGGQVSLMVGLTATIAAALIGTTIGIISGYAGGRTDAFVMRVTDGVIALPLLPLLIVLAAIDLNKLGIPESIVSSEDVSLYRIIIIVALAGWTTVARLVRASTLSIKTRPFVLAARAQGASAFRIMTVHILPNLMSPIIVATTLSVGNVILLESVLSFLGLGIQPPLPSWGNLLTGAQETIWEAPHLAFFPGMLIFATVIAFNFIGDGLQDALDPRADDRR